VTAGSSLGEHMTVILIPKAAEKLRELQGRTRMSKTDLANRAITLYEFIDARLREGCDVIARDQATGRTKLVQLHDAPAGQVPLADPRLRPAGAAGARLRPGRHRRQPPAIGRWRIPAARNMPSRPER
jgi:hypothetical protein